MELLARHPITENHCIPHFGKPIAAFTHNGAMAYGYLDRIHDGHIILRPMDRMPVGGVNSFQQSLKADPKVKETLSKRKRKNVQAKLSGLSEARNQKANVKFAGRYPYGWGYRNYGWGLGWWWAFPLFGLAALAALPFFFW